MKITSVAQVRNDLLQLITDYLFSPIKGRSFLNVSMSVDYVGGPHGAIVRSGYVVPPNKYAIVDGCAIAQVVTTAGSTNFFATTYINFVPTSGPDQVLLKSYIRTNNINISKTQHLSGKRFMSAGEAIQLITIDTGTADIVAHNLSINISEFDL